MLCQVRGSRSFGVNPQHQRAVVNAVSDLIDISVHRRPLHFSGGDGQPVRVGQHRHRGHVRRAQAGDVPQMRRPASRLVQNGDAGRDEASGVAARIRLLITAAACQRYRSAQGQTRKSNYGIATSAFPTTADQQRHEPLDALEP